MKKIYQIILILVTLLFYACSTTEIKDPENEELGVDINGNLRICPDKPYCVSSQDPNPKNFLEPIFYGGNDTATAMEEIITILDDNETLEYQIVNVRGGYLRATRTSSIFRLKDEIEFFFNLPNNEIHFRSSLVNGFFDFGSNKSRIKKIRQALEN